MATSLLVTSLLCVVTPVTNSPVNSPVVCCDLQTYRAKPRYDRSVALIAQLVEHCTGNARAVGSNTVQRLNFFPVIFPVVLWLLSLTEKNDNCSVLRTRNFS